MNQIITTDNRITLNNLSIRTKKRPHVFTPPAHDFILDSSSENLEAVFYAISQNKPCLLVGETGTGKTSLVRYLASITNQAYRRVNLNGQTNTDDLIGKWVVKEGSMVWVDGVLVEAMKMGYWLVLDELNSALPEVLFLLQSLLDDDKFIVLSEKNGEIIRPHSNFRLFATMNPSGNYTGTNDLNRALLSRFPVVVKYDYVSQKLESKILELHNKKAKLKSDKLDAILRATKIVRQAYQEGSTGYPLSTRDLIQLVQLSGKFTFELAFKFAILNKSQDDSEAKFLTDVFQSMDLLTTKENVKSTAVQAP